MTRASRVVTFAGSSISVASADAESSAIVERLFGSMQANGAATPRIALSLGRDGASGDFLVSRDETIVYRGVSGGAAAAALLEESSYHLADGSRGGLLFHAAAVARGDRAILLPAPTGAGKTTLTAWLVSRGFRYLTDELSFVPSGSTCVEAFRRPLYVKTAARRVLASLVDFAGNDAVTPAPQGFLVPPSLFRRAENEAADDGEGAALPESGLLLFPTYCAGAAAELQAISAARAAVRLLSTLVNARSLPGHGFADTARLAKTIPAYTLTYGSFGSFERIDERLMELLEEQR